LTVSRKADHLRINIEENVAAKGVSSGFENYRFAHLALPELDLEKVSTRTTLFGRRLDAPILISCMTGGVPEAQSINRTLATVAEEFHLPIGLGSGRVLLEHPEVLPSFNVRDLAPSVPLFANLGAVQLNSGVTADDCRKLVDLLRADALVLHLNALQEALQVEGNTNFRGLLGRIETLTRQIGVPVIVKEIGWGISRDLVVRLFAAGVSAVDVAGAGGTSWSEVERHRQGGHILSVVAESFADWGLPTAEALRDARLAAPDSLIFASGGIRSGMDVAKAVALGADIVGLAGPFLRAAAEGIDQARNLTEALILVLRTTMFATGTPDLTALRGTPRLRCTDSHVGVISATLSYATPGSHEFVDITDDVKSIVSSGGIRDGIAHIASVHTTASISINENEPLLLDDFRTLLHRLAPVGDYEHNDLSRRNRVAPDEPQNGDAHCRALLLSPSESVPISSGRLDLGEWQRIFLVELDGPRDRRVNVQVIGR
jgi:isopentenyl-diphosphate delta-isomerase